MDNSKTEHHQKIIFWRSVFFLAFILYCVNNLILYFVVADNLSLLSIAALLSIKTLPLLVFIPWLIKPNFKVAISFCCLLLFYFSFTAVAMLQEGHRGLLAIIEGFILAGLFWSAYKLGKLH